MQRPKYHIPSMREIEQIPWNGYNVISTFSGGGGSCLGYRMAGYRVLYANEFVEEAQKTYKANHKRSYLDARDIRTVKPQEILQITGLKQGELDIFDGSPPCCAFSTSGKREKGWGNQRNYSDGKSQRVDDLFFEYTRILKGMQPKVFIAENVSGLVKGTAKGYFKLILQELKSCGYTVKAQLLNAQWLGVPESRERLIFIGVRNDLGLQPVFPKPFQYCYKLRDALEVAGNSQEEIEYCFKSISKYKILEVLQRMPKNPPRPLFGNNYTGGSYFNLIRESMDCPCTTICQTGGVESAAGCCHPTEDRKFTISEIKAISSVPKDFVLTGSYQQQYERVGRMVPPIMMKNISEAVKGGILCKIKS